MFFRHDSNIGFISIYRSNSNFKRSLEKDVVICACAYKPKKSDKYTKPEWIDEHNDGKQYLPSLNIAPTNVTPVIVPLSSFKQCNGYERAVKPMMWGMIPPWQKDTYRHNLSTNNCRLENINTSKLYHPALRDGGRCVVVMEGFYEWQTTNKTAKTKQPYYIYAEQNSGIKVDEPNTWNNSFSEEKGWDGIRLLHVAGLYNVWNKNNITMYSYSIITMNSNKTLDWLHHRMPAVLETEEQINAWLDIENVKSDKALTYLKPSETLQWHPVSTNVNFRYNSQDCNKRIILEHKATTSQRAITSWLTTNKRKSGDDCQEIKRVKK